MTHGAYRPHVDEYQVTRILKLKKQGLSGPIISRRLGIPTWTVNDVIRRRKENKNEKGLRSQPRLS